MGFFFVKVIASMCLYKVYFYCHWLDVFKGNYGIKRDRTVSGRGNNEEGNIISCYSAILFKATENCY